MALQMHTAVLLLLPFLGAAGASPVMAASPSPYPSSAAATSTLYVYSAAGLSPGDLVTLETLGGGLARAAPALYRVPHTLNDTSSYVLWLNEMEAHFGVRVNTDFMAQSVPQLLEHFKGSITGFVKFNATQGSPSFNAALTWIAGQASQRAHAAPATAAAFGFSSAVSANRLRWPHGWSCARRRACLQASA